MENKEETSKSEIPTDLDGHESPLKASYIFEKVEAVYTPEKILVDDTDKEEQAHHMNFLEGVTLVCKFVELVGEFFHFREKGTDRLIKTNKHQSIIAALNKINFSRECELEIKCIGDDKFKITKK